jgi:hypothetical protein
MRSGIATLIVIGVAGVILGQSAAEEPPASAPAESGRPKLEISSTLLDFGEVWQGEPVAGEFTVRNVGTAPLTLSIKSSCGCAAATVPKSELAPGEQDSFRITYDTLRRRGKASQQVTLLTNDPDQPTVVIHVRGNVKPLYVTDPPEEGLVFHGLTTDQVATRKLRFESRYDGPLYLKLKEGQDLGPFEVDFQAIEPGRVYELTATTRPPLKEDVTRIELILETGLEKSPQLKIPLHMQVRPDVSCRPKVLRATRRSIAPIEQAVALVCRADRPIRVKAVRPTLSAITWQIQEPRPERAASGWMEQIVRVKLPPGSQFPEGEVAIEIETDSADPRYQRFKIPVQVVETASATRPAGAPPDLPTENP